MLIIVIEIDGMLALAVIVGFAGQENIRHGTIFWKEKVEQAVILEDIDRITQIGDIKGVGIEPNPILLSRTSFAHILTVINNETANHRFHIDVFSVQADLLEPGDQEIIIIYLDKKDEFTYSDKR